MFTALGLAAIVVLVVGCAALADVVGNAIDD